MCRSGAVQCSVFYFFPYGASLCGELRNQTVRCDSVKTGEKLCRTVIKHMLLKPLRYVFAVVIVVKCPMVQHATDLGFKLTTTWCGVVGLGWVW